MAHMRVHGSYARRTLAKLTRLECGTRAGWQCKFIQNSKEPSARSTSPCSPHVSPDSSPPLFPVSFSFSFPSSLPFRGRCPRLQECSVHREKRLIIRQKIRHSDNSFRSTVEISLRGPSPGVTKSALSNRELKGGATGAVKHPRNTLARRSGNHIGGLCNRVSK